MNSTGVVWRLGALFAVGGVLAACAQHEAASRERERSMGRVLAEPAGEPDATGGRPAQPASAGVAPVRSATAAMPSFQPGSQRLGDTPGLLNVIACNDTVLSGSVPKGGLGLDTLAALGVRTIVSVDGARPDVAAIEARGMRSVHIPVEYSGITGGELDAIASAMWNQARPIYIHCHHGKHRGPTAAALGLIATGELDRAGGVALLEEAGTSEAYDGLWRDVRKTEVFEALRWERVPRVLPAVVEPEGLLDAMLEINTRWDNLGLLADHGWAVPDDHPDLVPAAEAGIMADHFRTSLDDAGVVDGPGEMAEWMAAAASLAVELEDTLAAGDQTKATEIYTKIGTSCKSCHRVYRD